MAVSKSMTSSERRWMYGANVALNIVLAVAVMALVLWSARRFGGQADLTSAGLNSLSQRTVNLVRELDQDITLTALYTTALKEIRPDAEKNKTRVSDLLDLYDSAGRGHVTTHVIDPSETPTRATELLARLREKPAYKDAAAGHIDALARFPELKNDMAVLLQGELEEFRRLVAADEELAKLNETAVVERRLEEVLRDGQETERGVAQIQGEDVPRFADALRIVRDHLTLTQQVLQVVSRWMGDEGVGKPNIEPESRTFFAGAAQRYEAALTEIEAVLADTADLETPELETVIRQINAGQVILVETAEEVTVLPEYEIFPFRRDGAGGPQEREFAGEQELSSAILRMTQTDRTAVVFVRFGGMSLLESPQQNPMAPMQMPEAPYSAMRELLENGNFITQEWDVQAAAEPPVVADAARTIYVVLPPPPTPRSMGQPPPPPMSPEQRQAVTNAVESSGMGVFLAGWQRPSMPFGGGDAYVYGDYLRTMWGIDVKSDFLTMHFRPHPQRERLFVPRFRDELMLTNESYRFTDHPITAPLKSLPGAFAAVAPLEIVSGEGAVAGVTIEPIVELADRDDIWAFSDLMRIQNEFNENQGTMPHDDDLRGPFALALAATRGESAKLVVFSSEQIAANSLVNASQLMIAGGQLVQAQLYPANSDLFLNTLHWLSGDANRIAVGPQRGDVPRLDKLEAGPIETFVQWFIVGIWPGLALLAGVGVWLMRRR